MHVPDWTVPSACCGPARRAPPRNAFLRLARLLLVRLSDRGRRVTLASLIVALVAPAAAASDTAVDPARSGHRSADAPSLEIHRWTDPAGQPVFADRIAPGVSGEIVTTRVPNPDAAMRARAEQERAYWQAQSAAFARRQLGREREIARDYQISAGRAPDRRPSWAELPVRRPVWVGTSVPGGNRRPAIETAGSSSPVAPVPGPGVGAPAAGFLGSGFATGR